MHSAGKASSGNSDEKTVPNYLRASTGSCHDFCKYGRKHAFGLKERRSVPSRDTRKKLHQSSEESIGGIVKSVARPRASVDSKICISDTSPQELPTKSNDSQKHVGNEILVNRNKTSSVKVKPSLLLKSRKSPSMRQEISSSSVKEVQSSSKSISRKVKSPSKSTPEKVETPLKSTLKKVETPSKSTLKKVVTPSKSTPKKVETPSESTLKKTGTLSKSIPKKMEASSKSDSKKMENSSKSTSKVKTLPKSTSKMVGASSQLSSLNGKEMNLSRKRVSSLNHVTRKQISSTNSSEGSGNQKSSEIKMEKRVASSKEASRKLIAPSKALSSPKPSLKRVVSIKSRKPNSLKIVSHLRSQQTSKKVELGEQNKDEIEEKTLYVIPTESGNKALQSDQNANYDDESCLPPLSSPKFSSSSISQSLSQEDQEESEYTSSEFEQDSSSENSEMESMENEGKLDVKKKGKAKKGGVVCSEDKDGQMIKLKFRRGTVVDNQLERSTPRRLKFRRAKLLGEKASVKDEAKRRSFKKRDEPCSDDNGAASQEKIVLRHQDTQDKKDSQGLLNNVIEETANKLVEARKSKVKALVGAFETVISLQEKKPSTNNAS